MKQNNTLYYVTATALLLTTALAIGALTQTMQPTADITSARSTLHTIDIRTLKPGEATIARFDTVPVVFWRRSFEQQIEALEQLGIEVPEKSPLWETIRTEAAIDITPDQRLNLEWFPVSPINHGGLGCLVILREEYSAGYYDPCQDGHFDLWRQVKEGATKTDLHPLPWSLSEDSHFITIDKYDAPKQD